ncbi:MAG: (Fe-S)-binding protein [Chromatiales bacterium]|nr:(Fe-S)-binding protein [Chromatiales bacterium]
MNYHATILSAADRCVMCGLCLPHCPTYQLHHSELESPRGRIALLQAVAAGKLSADESLLAHLDSCLVCRACEKMCPSKVPYGDLIDAGRALLREQGQPARPMVKQLLHQISDKKRLQRNGSLLRSYQRSGVQRLLRASGLLKLTSIAGAEKALPPIPPRQTLAPLYPATGALRGRVGLFTGCISSLLEGEVQQAAIALLTTLGYEVHVPQNQRCCGSLHQHNGEPQRAAELADDNIPLFDEMGLDAVVSTASGCAAQLSEYPRLYGQGHTPFYEVCDFLSTLEWPDTIQLKPLQQTVWLHLPCSQRNVIGNSGAVAQLLSRIPQLQLEALPENHLCCGSAGSYQLTRPDNASALRERKLNLIDSTAELIVSNNLGCALHLQSGLEQRGSAVEVIHPLLLLVRALP